MGIKTGDYDGTSYVLLRIAETLRHQNATQKPLPTVTAEDVMNSFDQRLKQAREEAKQDFMKQLIGENKRRAR